MARNTLVNRSVTNNQFIARPIQKSDETVNQQLIRDLADVIYTPPDNVGADYLATCQRMAAFLGNPSQIPQDTTSPFQRPLAQSLGQMATLDTNSDVAIRNSVMSARNNVYEVINRVSAQSFNNPSSATPFKNPFSVIADLNGKRQQNTLQMGNAGLAFNLTPQLADDLVNQIMISVNTLDANTTYNTGNPSPVEMAAQLSSVTVSVDGFGSDGHAATDLMRFLADSDEIREAKNNELLAAFDFSKRIPKILFTADYDPTGEGSVGCAVGWKRIPDASGYVISRRSCFDNTMKTVTLTNDDVKSQLDHVKDYINAWVLTFYDKVDENLVWVYLDHTVQPDQQYIYTIQAFQVHNDTKDHVFSVATTSTTLSSVTRTQISMTLRTLSMQRFGDPSEDSINPWPLISQQLYGNSMFDWILAGANVRASINRLDTRTDTRHFSYLGGRVTKLFDFMDRGLFVQPKDIQEVVKNVNASVAHFGVTQTIAEILHETGILYYFEGTEEKRSDGFQRGSGPNIQASPLLSIVIAAIDPETATLDLRSLTANLPEMMKILASKAFGNYPEEVTGMKLNPKVPQPNPHAGASEINVPDLHNPVMNQGDIEFLHTMGPTSTLIDLNTFEGLSMLVRVIKIFADEGPHRGGQDSTVPPAPVMMPTPMSPIGPQFVGMAHSIPPTPVAGIPVTPPSAEWLNRPAFNNPLDDPFLRKLITGR